MLKQQIIIPRNTVCFNNAFRTKCLKWLRISNDTPNDTERVIHRIDNWKCVVTCEREFYKIKQIWVSIFYVKEIENREMKKSFLRILLTICMVFFCFCTIAENGESGKTELIDGYWTYTVTDMEAMLILP